MPTYSFVANSIRSLRTLFLTLGIVCVLASTLCAAPKAGFKAFIVGNLADVQPAPTLSPGLVLMGGGTDVDAAFQWMCQRAGGGDFVVIRTSGTDAYNRYIQQLCPQMDSVETIIINNVNGANSDIIPGTEASHQSDDFRLQSVRRAVTLEGSVVLIDRAVIQ